MKTSLVLFHQGALEKFPYLHYIYDAIIDQYARLGSCKALGFKEVDFQKITAAGNLSLLAIEMPDASSLKRGLWERFNYPALVRQLQPENIFYIGTQLPVLKDAKGAKQWCFVPDVRKILIAEDAKNAVVKKHRRFLAALALADKIVSYSPTVTDAIAGQLPLADSKLVTWLPVPDRRYLDAALYTEELLDAFKRQNTNETSYFLVDARIALEQEVIEYLKAFSHFKKWQRSSMQLGLIIAPSLHHNGDFMDKFDAYFYKEDVHLLSSLEKKELYAWIRSAYAVITPDPTDQGLDVQLATVSLGTLIIAPDSPAAAVLLPKARFDLPAFDKESFGQVLISSYKSEILRTRHINAGLACIEKWSEYTVADLTGI